MLELHTPKNMLYFIFDNIILWLYRQNSVENLMKMGKACPPLVYPLTTTHTHTETHTRTHTETENDNNWNPIECPVRSHALSAIAFCLLSYFGCYCKLFFVFICHSFTNSPLFPLFPRQPITPQTSSNDLSLASFVSPSTLYSLYRIALRNWLNSVDTIV